MTKIEFIEQQTTKILQAYKALEELGVIVDVSPVKLDTSAYLDIFGPIYHRKICKLVGMYSGVVEVEFHGVVYYSYRDPELKYYEIKNRSWGK